MAVPLMTSADSTLRGLPHVVYTPSLKEWHQIPGRVVSVLAKPCDCVQSSRVPYSRLWLVRPKYRVEHPLSHLRRDTPSYIVTNSHENRAWASGDVVANVRFGFVTTLPSSVIVPKKNTLSQHRRCGLPSLFRATNAYHLSQWVGPFCF